MTARAHPLDGSISVSYALALVDYVEQHGRVPAELFGADRVRQIRGGPGATRISGTQWASLLLQACRGLQDPALPLKLAATVRTRHLGMLGYLLMSCEDLASAAITLKRYESLLIGLNEIEFDVKGELATVTWRPLVERPPVEFSMLSMSLWVHQARWLTEQADLGCDVRLTFADSGDPRVHACLSSTFGGQVLYGQAENSITFPARYLSLPVTQRDRHVHESLRRRADADLQEMAQQDARFVERLEAMIADRLEGGEASLHAMSAALGMAPRTMQNKLDRLGVSYREVLNRVRREQAERLLRNPEVSLVDVTVMLGFSQQSAFHHAFKRWTGASPGTYRRRYA